MADAPEIYDDAGVVRKLGTLVPPPGQVSVFAPYLTAGPLFTLDEIRNHAKANDTLGRTIFDTSWIKDQKSHGCHDDKTEVLTEKGWVAWPDYNWSDLLGTMNQSTGRMEFQAPIEKHVYDYDGPLLYSDNTCVDMAVTTNHRMYVRKWNEANRTLETDYQFIEAAKLGWYAGLPSATTGFLGVNMERISIPDSREFLGNDFVAMLALIISDGWVGGTQNNCRQVSFCCFREDKYEATAALAHRIGFNELPGRRGVWIRTDGALANWLRVNIFTGNVLRSPYKHIPDVVKTLCEEQIKLFLHFFGDKSHNKPVGSRQFYSSSKRLIDDIQEILLRVGRRSTIGERGPRNTRMADGRVIDAENCHKEYTLTERKADKLSLCRKQHVREDRYKGQVYCATVPNSTLITRRNGSVLISGNSCNGFAAAAALSRARVRRRLARVDLSGAFVYSKINGGRDQGSVLEDGMRVIQAGGICSEQTVGWDQIYPSKYDKAKADAEAARFKAFECYTLGTEEELFSALMGGFDCVVAVDVNNSYMRLNSEGVAGGGRGAGNHAICLDGYKVLANGQLAADNPGSWNTTFGDNGRCFLTWAGHFANTVRSHVFYAVRSATDDPQGDNPPDIGGSD